jgi:hypothetical protein
VYDNTGKTYNVSRVINKQDGYQLDVVKYESYSTVCTNGIQRERLPDEVLDLFTDHLCAQSVWSRFRYHSLALHLASIGEKRPNLECPHVH